ncbi:hypothetical protein C8Q76DRAFT_413649 [Earliella scabrosa]|nr:hypothetical protein C8Q76DRAFT_413649 [Earliella scabrosa]
MRRLAQITFGATLLPMSWALAVSTGQGRCLSTELDWYTSIVGETPCETYQRLRQVCHTSYQVFLLPSQVPADTCDDPVPGCCCNSIAFQLSMLCLNCQRTSVVNGTAGGISAPPGSLQKYLASCPDGTGRSLPQDVQSAVCNEGLRIDDFLYDGSSNDGSWVYSLVKDSMMLEQKVQKNSTFSRCSNTTSNSNAIVSSSESSPPGPTSSPTERAGQSSESTSRLGKPSTGAIIGAVLGGVGPLAIIGAICWFCAGKRGSKRDAAVQTDTSDLDGDSKNKPTALMPAISPVAASVSHIGARTSFSLRGALVPARTPSLRNGIQLPTAAMRRQSAEVVLLRPMSSSSDSQSPRPRSPSIYSVRRSTSEYVRPPSLEEPTKSRGLEPLSPIRSEMEMSLPSPYLPTRSPLRPAYPPIYGEPENGAAEFPSGFAQGRYAV